MNPALRVNANLTWGFGSIRIGPGSRMVLEIGVGKEKVVVLP